MGGKGPRFESQWGHFITLKLECIKKKTWYQSLVWREVWGSSHLSTICSPFVYLKVYGGLYLVCLTLHMGPHVRESVKKHDIHIKPCYGTYHTLHIGL